MKTTLYLILVDVDGEHRSEDLLCEDLICWGVDLDDGRLDEKADAIVVGAAGDDLAVRGAVRVVDVAADSKR